MSATEAVTLVSCECEHADHFDHAIEGVTVLNGTQHDYLLQVETHELASWRSMFGTFMLCGPCREGHADPQFAAEGGAA